MSKSLRVGYIGLGLMGKSIARNILKAGFPLVVHNRSQAAVDELAAEGAQRASSPADVAAQVDVVFTNLPDSPDVELVALGAGGIIEGAHAGLILVDNSTIKPATARQIALVLGVQGVQCLDAPVSGGDIGARQGTLAIMVGGPSGGAGTCAAGAAGDGQDHHPRGRGRSRPDSQGSQPDHGGGADGGDGRADDFCPESRGGSAQGGGSHSRRGGAVLDAGCQTAAPICRQPLSRFQGVHAGQRSEHCVGNRPAVRYSPAFGQCGCPALQRHA